MSKKSLINSVSTAVDESLTGFSLTYPCLELHANKRVVLAPHVSFFYVNKNKLNIIII